MPSEHHAVATSAVEERRSGYPTATRDRRDAGTDRPPTPVKEPPLAQIASFVGFFIWLLTFKSFFLPLFIL